MDEAKRGKKDRKKSEFVSTDDLYEATLKALQQLNLGSDSGKTDLFKSNISPEKKKNDNRDQNIPSTSSIVVPEYIKNIQRKHYMPPPGLYRPMNTSAVRRFLNHQGPGYPSFEEFENSTLPLKLPAVDVSPPEANEAEKKKRRRRPNKKNNNKNKPDANSESPLHGNSTPEESEIPGAIEKVVETCVPETSSVPKSPETPEAAIQESKDVEVIPKKRGRKPKKRRGKLSQDLAGEKSQEIAEAEVVPTSIQTNEVSKTETSVSAATILESTKQIPVVSEEEQNLPRKKIYKLKRRKEPSNLEVVESEKETPNPTTATKVLNTCEVIPKLDASTSGVSGASNFVMIEDDPQRNANVAASTSQSKKKPALSKPSTASVSSGQAPQSEHQKKQIASKNIQRPPFNVQQPIYSQAAKGKSITSTVSSLGTSSKAAQPVIVKIHTPETYLPKLNLQLQPIVVSDDESDSTANASGISVKNPGIGFKIPPNLLRQTNTSPELNVSAVFPLQKLKPRPSYADEILNSSFIPSPESSTSSANPFGLFSQNDMKNSTSSAGLFGLFSQNDMTKSTSSSDPFGLFSQEDMKKSTSSAGQSGLSSQNDLKKSTSSAGQSGLSSQKDMKKSTSSAAASGPSSQKDLKKSTSSVGPSGSSSQKDLKKTTSSADPSGLSSQKDVKKSTSSSGPSESSSQKDLKKNTSSADPSGLTSQKDLKKSTSSAGPSGLSSLKDMKISTTAKNQNPNVRTSQKKTETSTSPKQSSSAGPSKLAPRNELKGLVSRKKAPSHNISYMVDSFISEEEKGAAGTSTSKQPVPKTQNANEKLLKRSSSVSSESSENSSESSRSPRLNRMDSVESNLPPLYDDNGIYIANGKDICDCLIPQCPGCFFGCPKCGSPKCGLDCRVRRSHIIEEAVYEGTKFVYKFEDCL